MSRSFRYTATSELQNLGAIARFVADAAQALGLDARTTYAVQAAVDEACTNIILYAYQGQPGQPVTVECHEESGTCVVVIRDQGRPFDPLSIPVPNVRAPLFQRQEGGLGIYLMCAFMDDVRFRFDAERGNELTLVKTFRSQGENGRRPDAGSQPHRARRAPAAAG